MKRLFCSTIFALMLGLLAAGSASATTYYIAANGSDSNSGTSESSPWAHLPGMATWTGNHTPAAGDTFTLRGCDDWGNSNFPVSWKWGGTSGSHITITADQTWYNTSNCPNGWNRPVFDAGQAVMGGGAECSVNNMFLNISGVTYVDFDWIELKNYYNNSGSCSGKDRWVNIGNPGDYITFNNFYVHASFTGPSSSDNDSMWGVASLGMCMHCAVTYSVINNSDGTQYTAGGIQFSLQHSICQYVSNCSKIVIGGEVSYNDIEHVGTVIGGVHPNCIETVANYTQTWWIHDNRVHAMDGPHEQCETLQIGNTGETDYVWNNVFYDLGGGDIMRIPQGGGSGVVALYFINNTFAASGGNVCINNGTSSTNWTSAFVMENNHCITPTSPGGTSQSQQMMSGTNISGANTIEFANNVVESLATANANGYTGSQTYTFSPTSSASATVGLGANLTSTYWPSGFSANDTSYACSQQTVTSGTVYQVVEAVCPVRSSVGRPSSGAWDVGAYEFGAADTAPNAPSALKATVQ